MGETKKTALRVDFDRSLKLEFHGSKMLNAIDWTANIEVPKGGVPSATPTREELDANQDDLKPKSKDKGKE